jgi:hypothetical protein
MFTIEYCLLLRDLVILFAVKIIFVLNDIHAIAVK